MQFCSPRAKITSGCIIYIRLADARDGGGGGEVRGGVCY